MSAQFEKMAACVDEVLFVHQAAEWRVVIRRTFELFQTELFKRSDWIRRVCETVPYMYVMENLEGGPIQDLPVGHFGTYTRCTPRRPYANPYVEDLYWLHEITHLVTWLSGGSHAPPILRGEHELWHDWEKRMIGSELVASVYSECLAHVLIPGLRDQTFRHPIWVDRFLNAPGFLMLIGKDPVNEARAYSYLAEQRMRVLEGHHAFDDYVERQIAGYYKTNQDWVVLFGRETIGFGPHTEVKAFRCVENHLPDADDPERHVQWIKEVTPTKTDLVARNLNPSFQVPLGFQAHSFGAVFREYLTKYGNAVFFA